MKKLLFFPLILLAFGCGTSGKEIKIKCLGNDCPEKKKEVKLSGNIDEEIRKLLSEIQTGKELGAGTEELEKKLALLIEERAKRIAQQKLKQEEATYRKEKIEKELAILKTAPTPIKAPDTVIRVLILPYVDSNGVLNAAKYTFLTVETGKWIIGDYLLTPAKTEKIKKPLIDEKIRKYLNEKRIGVK
jgi:hypothetical protein